MKTLKVQEGKNAREQRVKVARLLTHEEVTERARRFYDLLARERTLQDFLVKLRIKGDQETVRRLIQQHDETIAEIRRIRIEEIVPIVTELNEYIKAVETEKRSCAQK
ncbi:MAG: hypothetical protein HY692_00390 [Cyanobacteria bacterium NC_groundwater_1444_Ag_S-0.65um_54_12]|nr:hypothetical protein [Cyanobacteria bacterium NC_groundwater_1444_Ag_S-0.65um_54_12]